MKRLVKSISIVLALAMAFSLLLVFSAAAIVDPIKMNGYSYEATVTDILAKGQVSSDATKFDDGGRTPEAGDNGHTMWHAGNGDEVSFPMDFDTYSVIAFSFKAVVSRGTDTITLKIDDQVAGSGTANSNGQVVKFNLDKAYTGSHIVTIAISSTTVVWPGSDLGNFTFYAEYCPKMNANTFNIPCSDLVANATITSDPTKFDDGGRTPEAGDAGQTLWHAGNGDAFEFNIDFDTYEANEFSFKSVVSRGTDTVKVYIDDVLAGSGTSNTNGQVVKFALDKAYTGKHKVKIALESTTVAWPGSDIGSFYFYAPKVFKMTDTTTEFLASEIVAFAEQTSDPTKFDRGVRVVEAGDEGHTFWHSGNGDTFTINADFDKYSVDEFSYKVIVSRGDMTVKVYIDDALAGSGTGTENGVVNVTLDKAYTGKHTIKFAIEADATEWPGCDYGEFKFTGEENPGTGDVSIALAIMSFVTLLAGVIVLKKRENLSK